jgi:hypothetical protein
MEQQSNYDNEAPKRQNTVIDWSSWNGVSSRASAQAIRKGIEGVQDM